MTLDYGQHVSASEEYASQARTGYDQPLSDREPMEIDYSRATAAALAVQEAILALADRADAIAAALAPTPGAGRTIAEAICVAGDVQP